MILKFKIQNGIYRRTFARPIDFPLPSSMGLWGRVTALDISEDTIYPKGDGITEDAIKIVPINSRGRPGCVSIQIPREEISNLIKTLEKFL